MSAGPVLVDHDWISRHIPHQGTMCLLHGVQRWSDNDIHCLARSHCTPDNPLRNAQGLPISVGIEYAAQAMAVHAALLTPAKQRPDLGYLTSVRNVQWWVTRLDDVGPEISVQASRLSGNEVSLLYEFSILCGDRLLLSGRAGVMIKPPASDQNSPAA